MQHSDDFRDHGSGLPITYMTLGAFSFVLLVIGLVLYLNREPPHNPSAAQTTSQEQSTEESTDSEIKKGKITSDQLDFWDMYPEGTTEEATTQEPTEEQDISSDGKHTLVVHPDGKEEWVLIDTYLKQNDYDYKNLVYQYPIMKYYVEGVKASYVGVDVSKYNEYIDYQKLKKAGVQFVMIRLGARGYGSGQLTVDEYFFDNMKGATDAGLKVGVYFYSQAVTQEEALEEANTVIANLAEYEIEYPVAFQMEYVEGDTARVEALTREEKTEIAKAFLDAVKEAGYTPMLYGTKEWLIKKLDLKELTDYDIWLSEEKDVPDYPYRFGMWQYSKKVKIDGIAGNANCNISFVDYSEK